MKRIVIVLAAALMVASCSKKTIKVEMIPIAEYQKPVSAVEKEEPKRGVVFPEKSENIPVKSCILFAFDSDKVRSIEYINIVELSKCNTIRLIGGACPIGDESYNYGLGLRRAYSVKNALVEYGISSEKITCESVGEAQLITDNPSQYKENRRCEIHAE